MIAMTTHLHRLTPAKVWLGVIPTLWWNDDFINIDIGIPYEQALSEMALAGYVGCGVGHGAAPRLQRLFQSTRRSCKASLSGMVAAARTRV